MGSNARHSPPIGGNPNRIAWVGQYKDLADDEAATVKSLADPEDMDLLVTASDLFSSPAQSTTRSGKL